VTLRARGGRRRASREPVDNLVALIVSQTRH